MPHENKPNPSKPEHDELPPEDLESVAAGMPAANQHAAPRNLRPGAKQQNSYVTCVENLESL